jgi:uncharacterized membrane protein YesL
MTAAPAFQRLTARDWIGLAVVVALGRAWVAFDQDLLPERLLLPAFLLILGGLVAGFFALVRPAQPFALARTVALVLALVVTALIVVQHVILTFDLSYKAGIILGATAAWPFVVAAGNTWVKTRS